jgi:hypothetical protein
MLRGTSRGAAIGWRSEAHRSDALLERAERRERDDPRLTVILRIVGEHRMSHQSLGRIVPRDLHARAPDGS